jgi:hypothetical protein
MHQFWISSIADPETGIATYPKVYGLDYSAKNHTGEMMYIVTRPDVNNVEKRNIEFAAYYTNVMPKKIPLSHFEYSQGEHNLVEIEIPFAGNMHISSKVDNYAQRLLSTSYSFVTQGLFDPEKANVGGRYLSEFTNDTGNVQQGLGDI